VKILLFGGRGQMGWELQRALSPFGDLFVVDRQKADFENPSQIEALIEAEAPNIVVNAAAYTAVDRAETDFHKARLVNAVAVESLAHAAFAQKALLIHYSTDYVYDGLKTLAYHESDPTNAMSVYGKTKCEGDEAILASGCEHLIFRTSWVHSARGNNFVRKILQLASEKSSLTVVADQLGTPTGAEMIADITALAIARRDSGLACIIWLPAEARPGINSPALSCARRCCVVAVCGLDPKPLCRFRAPSLRRRRPARAILLWILQSCPAH
jgi:dTDP-4-dehydrorhamnose reductase